MSPLDFLIPLVRHPLVEQYFAPALYAFADFMNTNFPPM